MTLEELEALRAKAENIQPGSESRTVTRDDAEYIVALVSEAPALLEELRLAREVVEAARAWAEAPVAEYARSKNLILALEHAVDAYDRRGVKP